MNNFDLLGAQNAGAAFQKAWLDSLSQAMQAAFPSSAGSPPVDLLRQLQESGFQAWNQCLNSPLFAASLKQWMGDTAGPGKETNAPTAEGRNEPTSPSRDDWDRLLQTVHQMEQYLHAQVDQLSRQTQELHWRLEALERKLPAAPLATQHNPQGRPRPGKGHPGAPRPE